MNKCLPRHSSKRKIDGEYLPARASVGAAVFLALYGVPHPASAQQQTDPQRDGLQAIIVTATRRQQTLEEVPYSITSISADQLASDGVTDIASLAGQVPGLSMYDFGARLSGATFPIIRGLNGDAPSAGFRTFEQAPVGTYIGNAPINGYFQLDDVQRVEILRGPQGTLYGAGALGGAVRIIPNAPQLNTWSGNIEVGGGTVAHSSDMSYTTSAMVNVPMGDTLAFRVSAKYAYEPGFINVYGILKRPGSLASGIPALADPADPVTSPGIFMGKDDWNDQNTFTGRASLLWQPIDKFNAQLAFVYSNLNGDGGPTANSTFPGGPYPLDPRITFPKGGDYQEFSPENQPYYRRTSLQSLDLSYDAGFATLSSTSAYFTSGGLTMEDAAYGLAALPSFLPYYAGNPTNPRFVNPSLYQDSAHTFTQEIRLVSTTSPERKLDYVAGLFYESQGRYGSWTDSNPGSPEYSVAQGCTAPLYLNYSTTPPTPAPFPNCLLTSGPGDVHFLNADSQHFQDKSVYGELTWHVTGQGQVTLGGRHFEQSFNDSQIYNDWTFPTFLPVIPHTSSASKNTWKVNPSYEYADHQYVYALWSQGFRRGGANSVPQAGIYKENQQLEYYAPDSVNNYEMGMKGRLDNGMSYSFDVFDIDWHKPQIGGTTPSGNFAVWNANEARSTGAEFDLNTLLPLPGLTITMSAAYAHARFTEDYSYAANNGAGSIVPGLLYGKAGEQLPGSPKVSAAATINYNHSLVPGYDLTVSLNDTYRSAETLSTFPSAYTPAQPVASGMNIGNCSAIVRHRSWRVGAYVTNVADKRIILVPGGLPTQINGLGNDATINRPREVDIRVGYSF